MMNFILPYFMNNQSVIFGSCNHNIIYIAAQMITLFIY